MTIRIPEEGDARFTFDAQDGHADISIVNRDLARDDGLETAITVSLFSNRRAEEDDELPDADGTREGWFGDALLTNGDKIGSKLWLLGRGKFNNDLLNDAEQYAAEALEWLVEDGVAGGINVTVERVMVQAFVDVAGVQRVDQSALKITVEVVRPDNGESVFFPYFYNWKNQVARRAA